MNRLVSSLSLLSCAVGLLACSAQPVAEAGRARIDPPAPASLERLHALLSAPGGLTAPAWASDYFNGDEIPEEAISLEAKIVTFTEEEGVEGYAKKRIGDAINALRYEGEDDVPDVLFLFNYPDTEFVLQSGSDVAAVLLALVPDVAPEGESITERAAVTAILDEGASYYHFRSTDSSAEMVAGDLIIVQPNTDDAENRALEVEIGCCGGY